MPTLKHLTCHVEWSSSNIPLEEYNTTYADGFVSTYIAIPSTPTPFSIHLTSHGYIAPGLAMFVYMDGVYQVNRNRHNLKIPGEGTKRSHTEVDFRVRQKEELLWDGSFEGKEWRFERANIGKSALLSGVRLLLLTVEIQSTVLAVKVSNALLMMGNMWVRLRSWY